MGKVEAVCVSARKAQKKKPLPSALFVADSGISGDAHAGAWHRQVSLLAAEHIERMREAGLPNLAPGDFAENVVTRGVDLSALGLGSRLRLGAEVELEVTQRGKTCHRRCAIYYQAGDCIMPTRGVFARVSQGGTVVPGDSLEVLEEISCQRLQAVVLTISDRCSRGETADTAGPAVGRLLESSLGAHVYAIRILPDDRDQIADRLKHYCDGHSIDLVVTAGGTGFSPRDVTPEAVASVIHRPAPGLDEAMRRASAEKTPYAMLSRSVSGIRNDTLIVSLPGSERGATESLEAVLPALGHGLAKLRGDPSDCAPPRGGFGA
ncbi:MAG: MOSC domain-containing protein [Bryobacterales bacterium]|nr:MOSC domain-containing protein [Bryobacterales bacterium]